MRLYMRYIGFYEFHIGFYMVLRLLGVAATGAWCGSRLDVLHRISYEFMRFLYRNLQGVLYDCLVWQPQAPGVAAAGATFKLAGA